MEYFPSTLCQIYKFTILKTRKTKKQNIKRASTNSSRGCVSLVFRKALLDLAESALLGSSALGLGSLSGEGGLSEVRAVDRKFMVDRSASVCSSTSSEEKVTWREVFVCNFCGNLPLCFT